MKMIEKLRKSGRRKKNIIKYSKITWQVKLFKFLFDWGLNFTIPGEIVYNAALIKIV